MECAQTRLQALNPSALHLPPRSAFCAEVHVPLVTPRFRGKTQSAPAVTCTKSNLSFLLLR